MRQNPYNPYAEFAVDFGPVPRKVDRRRFVTRDYSRTMGVQLTAAQEP
jgi:hypothetical protein